MIEIYGSSINFIRIIIYPNTNKWYCECSYNFCHNLSWHCNISNRTSYCELHQEERLVGLKAPNINILLTNNTTRDE